MHDTKRTMKQKLEQNSKTPPTGQSYQNIIVNSELVKDAKQRAHSIVLTLLEVGISEKFLSENIPYITPEHFEDVRVERAITGICGYPLCDSSMDKKPFESQTYVIRRNKVYDVTQRRNFCSDKCYEASEMIFHQIPTTPLYLRSSDEEDQPPFKLIIPNLASLKGKIGKRVNIMGPLIDPEVDLLKSEESSVDKNLNSSSDVDKDSRHYSSDEDSPDSSAITSDTSNAVGLLHEKTQKLCLQDEKKQNLNMSEQMVTENSTVVKEVKNVTTGLADVYEIEHILRDWMSFETLRMILGDVYVKGMLDHMGKIWQDYDCAAKDEGFTSIELRSKYVALCKKLNNDERKEQLMDAQDLADDDETKIDISASKSVPDYEQLQRDVEQSSLKVRAFYEGGLEFESCKETLPTIQEEGESTSNKLSNISSYKSKRRKGKSHTVGDEDFDSGTLPLIDNFSQKAWRRKIVLEKISKRLCEFARDFGLDEREVRRLVVALISTFELSSQNICFKMNQWKFVALILIKMLSVRYPAITRVFTEGEESHKLIAIYLRDHGLDQDYLTRLLSHLTDISFILNKYDNQNFIVDKDNESHTTRDAINLAEFNDKDFKNFGLEGAINLSKANDKNVKNLLNINKEEISTNFEELD